MKLAANGGCPGPNVIMAGIDHSLAGLAVREGFSFTKSAYEKTYRELLEHPAVEGAVILSTCNRTELYLSVLPGRQLGEDPFLLLCRAMGLGADTRAPHRVRRGREALRHLCLLGCGMKSQIWGEDQIIAQVKNALEMARAHRAADSVLEVLFRTAVTAAKRVRTQVALGSRETSVVDCALEILGRYKAVRRVLVVGNGEIGRLTAERLTLAGYEAAVTLRQYRHGVNLVPKGVRTVDYSRRYDCLGGCQAVVSATLSPHYTLKAQAVKELRTFPGLYIDLAVPRDIDPEIGRLPGVALYNMDNLSVPQLEIKRDRQRAQAQEIIDKYLADFDIWYRHKTQIMGA